MEQKKRSYEKWTDDEVQAQQDFESAPQNDQVCGRMADKLAELNIGCTPKNKFVKS
ncbi:hypothetical protein ABVT39_006553 [Epinephelus coioides]